jgi:hypothetical protein
MNMSNATLKSNITNPARVYLWNVIIAQPVGGGDTTTLMLRCLTSELPGRSFGTIEVPYKQGPNLQYSGKLKYDHTLACTFIESEDNKTFQAFYNWCQSTIHDVTNIGAGDTDIKTDISLQLITTKDEEYMQIKLKGCWVQSMGKLSLDYSTEGVVMLPITFRFDTWEKV